MGHFSPYTYLQRAIGAVFLLFYFLWSTWRADRFRTLSPERIARFELKSIVCILMLIVFPLELFYDFTEVRIAYAEGFIIDPTTEKTYVKPQQYWTAEDQSTIVYSDYIYDVALSMEASILFLLQCFWNYLASSITKKSFMGSTEWKIYMIWAMISLVLLPALQFAFKANDLYAEVFPQMAYALEVTIVSALGFLSHFRFNRLIYGYESTKRQLKNDIIVSKLNYFREMNAGLSICLALTGVMVMMLCIDALTPAKAFNASLEITDVAICIANIAGLIVWYILISIFFPPRTFSTNTSQHAMTTDDGTTMQMTPIKSGVYAYQSTGSHLSPSSAVRSPSPAASKSLTGIVKTVTVEIDDVGNSPTPSHDDSVPLHDGNYYPA